MNIKLCVDNYCNESRILTYLSTHKTPDPMNLKVVSPPPHPKIFVGIKLHHFTILRWDCFFVSSISAASDNFSKYVPQAKTINLLENHLIFLMRPYQNVLHLFLPNLHIPFGGLRPKSLSHSPLPPFAKLIFANSYYKKYTNILRG